ncbi:MAG: hypothetical protein IKC03_09000, partial [Oscillospiraceae bacterium]|nr:hypothetical protein [Oscillospiraceae bacterium]
MILKRGWLTFLAVFIVCLAWQVIPAFGAMEGVGTAVQAPVGGGIAQTDPVSNENSSGSLPDDSAELNHYYGILPPTEEILGLPDAKPVTTQDVQNWIGRKAGDILGLIILGVQYISVGVFVASLLLVGVGSISDKRTMVVGCWGTLTSCVIYAAVT